MVTDLERQPGAMSPPAVRDTLLKWVPAIAMIITCAVMLSDRWRGDGATMQALEMRIQRNSDRVETVEIEVRSTRDDTSYVRDELRKVQTAVVQLTERVTALIDRLERLDRRE